MNKKNTRAITRNVTRVSITKKATKIDKHRRKQIIKSRRPIRKKVFLHPAYIFVMMCAGVLIFASQIFASADDVSITATVPILNITHPAAITSPSNGQTIYYTPTNVQGTCQYGSYQVLYRDGYTSGEAFCPSSNKFSIVTDLIPGINHLVIKSFNSINQPGPDSPEVTITYNPNPPTVPTPNKTTPVVPASPTTSPATSPTATTTPNEVIQTPTTPYTIANNIVTDNGQKIVEAPNSPSPLAAKFANNSGFGSLQQASTYTYQTSSTGSSYKQTVDLKGGTPPYVVHIAWGDSTSSDLYFKDDPLFSIEHAYKAAGIYNIGVDTIDAIGEKVVLQLSTVVREQKTSPTESIVGFNNTTVPQLKNSVLSKTHTWLWLLWPAYGVIFLMTFSYWLGERESYLRIVKNRKQRKARR